jgi:hypothetical protein
MLKNGRRFCMAKSNGVSGDSAYVKGRRGRLPGHGRVPGSGLKKGQRVITAEIKGDILAKGRPIELLCNISRGLKIRVGPVTGPNAKFVYPTLSERISAAKLLLSKVVPDMRSIELGGSAEGEPIRTEHRDASSLGPNEEAARRIRLLLHMAEESEQEEEAPPTDGRPIRHTNGVAVTPVKSELAAGHELQLADGIVAKLDVADGRGGGDWSVSKSGEQVKKLPGLDVAGVKDWHAVAIEEGFYE